MRLFAALPLPEAAHDRLMRLRLRLGQAKDGLRWSSPEQWHLTLQFFGDLSPEQADRIGKELSATQGHTAELSLSTLDLFPAKGILFGAVDASPSLLNLQKKVQHAGERCGVMSDSRPFHPHITLARSKGKAGFRTLQAMSSPELPAFGMPIRWQAEEMHLLQSELRPEGAVYTQVARYALAQAPAESKFSHT